MKISKKLNIGLVGNGNIADFHAHAFVELGHLPNLLVSRDKNVNAKNFAEKHAIKKTVSSAEFLKNSNIYNLDGLIIACNTEYTCQYINWCKENDLWALAEKPVSFDLEQIKLLLDFDKCFVGFNRRYYPNINLLKKKIDNTKNKKFFIELFLPERTENNGLFGNPYNKIFSNCIHGVDLLFYLCGEINLRRVDIVLDNKSRVVTAYNEKFDIKINFLINSPTNFSLKVYGLNEFYDLTPFEMLTISSKLEVNQPTEKYPLKKYVPKIEEIVTAINEDFPKVKPGFYNQANSFVNHINQNFSDINFPNLKDAYKAQSFLQNIFKDLL